MRLSYIQPRCEERLAIEISQPRWVCWTVIVERIKNAVPWMAPATATKSSTIFRSLFVIAKCPHGRWRSSAVAYNSGVLVQTATRELHSVHRVLGCFREVFSTAMKQGQPNKREIPQRLAKGHSSKRSTPGHCRPLRVQAKLSSWHFDQLEESGSQMRCPSPASVAQSLPWRVHQASW